jgi:mRNA interferase RelE/StbE
MYEISFTLKAERQFSKLDKFTQNRIASVIDRIKIRPYSFVKKLRGTSYYRLRVGNYRVILDILKNKLIIFVIELGHRKNIYK